MNVLDKIGDWNPQLFREWKGRLKGRNIAIAVGISAIAQLLLCFFCGFNPLRYAFIQTWNHPDPLVQNYPYGSFEVFLDLSKFGTIALLAIGTYLIIADISKEERQGTLNFIRFSPQPWHSIAVGKLLGVPVLLYVAGAIALPLYLLSGLGAKFPISLLFGFSAVLLASCIFFYSVAFLFALTSSWLKGLQPWLGSLAILLFLSWATQKNSDLFGGFQNTFSDFFLLFSPNAIIHTFFDVFFSPEATNRSIISPLAQSSVCHTFNLSGYNFNGIWYGVPLWENAWLGLSLMLTNYTLWSYWLWQGLKRRFRNPKATIWSKTQSYLISISFMAVGLGFTLSPWDWPWQNYYSDNLFWDVEKFLSFLPFLSIGLIVALSPHRPALQEWARYRHQKGVKRRSLLKDLLWGKKSPATGAIALNFAIIAGAICFIVAIVPEEPSSPGNYRHLSLFSILLTGSLILLYASIVQWILLMKTKKRAILAVIIMSLLTVVYPLVLSETIGTDVLSLKIGIEANSPTLPWLFAPNLPSAIEHATLAQIGIALAVDWGAIALIHAQMARQLRSLGTSETKRLLSTS